MQVRLLAYCLYFDFKTNISINLINKGMVSTIQLQSNDPSSYGTGIKVAPMTTETVLNAKTCFWLNGTSDSPVEIQSVLPDATNFTFIGQANWKGITTDVYQAVNNEGDKKNTYSYYVNSVTGAPVYYEMIGYDTLLGSHYDRYYIEYFNFDTTPVDPSTFAISTDLKCGGFPGPGMKNIVSVNPMKEFIHNDDSHVHFHFDQFKKAHGKVYKNETEHNYRKNVFKQNLR